MSEEQTIVDIPARRYLSYEGWNFKLHIKTAVGNLWLPALSRCDCPNGEIVLSFSPYGGIEPKGYRLEVSSVTCDGASTLMDFPDVGHEDWSEICDDCSENCAGAEGAGVISVTLTPGAQKQLLAKLNSAAETNNGLKIVADYRPVTDRDDVEHRIIVRYPHDAEEYLGFGVNPGGLEILDHNGVIDDEYCTGRATTVKGKVPSQEAAECIVKQIRGLNRVLQTRIQDRAARAEEPEPTAA